MYWDYNEEDIRNNLLDAGCSKEEIECILESILEDKEEECTKMICSCRKDRLDKLHEQQKQIDCLDYLRYRLEKKRKEKGK